MPIAQVATGVIETVLNKLLSLDENSHQRVLNLAGKQLKVNLTEIPWPIVFHFSDQINVMAEHPDSPLHADCSLTMSIATLQKLQEVSQITALIQQKELLLEGDLNVAQGFSQLLTQLDIDWEEQLSHYTGDVIAHSIFATGNTALEDTKSRLRRLLNTVREGVIEEKQLAAHPIMVLDFCDQVDQVRSQAARLEARLNLLEQSQSSSHNQLDD